VSSCAVNPPARLLSPVFGCYLDRMKFERARALVTGGSEGIGKAIARALIEKGADVAITGRRRAPLEAAARELGCAFHPGDVGIEADAVRTVSEFVKERRGIDLLVNNAGFGVFAPLVETELADFEAVWRTNVAGAFLMAREAAKHMLRQRSGNIVNIGSTSGLKGDAESSAYSASKFALRALSECWRAELRRSNIRVIQVNPSEVVTRFGLPKDGAEPPAPPNKLRAEDIARAIVGALEVDDRGFIPEFAVFATNPF
jgi:3-oxoacyl-[acyl-carrier protein] reductase